MSQLSRELHRKFRQTLVAVPITSTSDGRNTLLTGIPFNIISGLNRSPTQAVDIDVLITQLSPLGRLVDTGERPLIIVAQNALDYAMGSSIGESLREVIRELEDYYGGEEPSNHLIEVPERLIFEGRDWRLPYSFVEKAWRASKCVARLKVPRFFEGKDDGTHSYGTGWLVTPNLMFTNHHVIEAREQSEPPASEDDFRTQAENTIAWFDYYQEGGSFSAVRSVKLLGANRKLDYTLLRLDNSELLDNRSQLIIVRQQLHLEQGARLNIIQHPRGGELRYAIRNNFYAGKGDEDYHLRYLTDTEPGSSGSPVLDDQWEVIGMHHAWRNVPPTKYNGKQIKYHNQGISIHPILANLSEDLRSEIGKSQQWE